MNDFNFDSNRNNAKNCPCGKNNEDGKFAPFCGCPEYGHCHSCGETFFPDNTKEHVKSEVLLPKATVQNKKSPIPKIIAERTGKHFKKNVLANFLVELTNQETTAMLLQKYYLGTANYEGGSSVFWHLQTKI